MKDETSRRDDESFDESSRRPCLRVKTSDTLVRSESLGRRGGVSFHLGVRRLRLRSVRLRAVRHFRCLLCGRGFRDFSSLGFARPPPPSVRPSPEHLRPRRVVLREIQPARVAQRPTAVAFFPPERRLGHPAVHARLELASAASSLASFRPDAVLPVVRSTESFPRAGSPRRRR